MRLLKAKVSGFRRFESAESLLVSDRLVAIVGPNEAGKSSLLGALEQISGTDPVERRWATRQADVPPRVEALFEIDDSDRQALTDTRGGTDVRRAWVIRTTEGTEWRLEPEPARDVQPRSACLKDFGAIGEDPALDAAYSGAESPWTDDVVNDAMSALGSEADTLSDEERVAIGRLANALDSLTYPAEPEGENLTDKDVATETKLRSERERERRKVAAALHKLGVTEAEPAPRDLARETLQDLLPVFLLFSDADRSLKADYDLNEALDGEGGVPTALQNFAGWAGLDLAQLRTAIRDGDVGTVHLIKETVNHRLRSDFEISWAQSDVWVEIDTDASTLRLLVSAEGASDFTPLDFRSDGLRWFVALRAFLAQKGADRTILLIDEVETHLHYAAQADLIDVLSNQTAVQQVIYTTHSVGALPPDLGCGVRAVVPIDGKQRSRIDNSFWTGGPGYTALLFGVGAETLAFSIPRRLVIAEGASDAILLPTLLREATGLAELPYRIAPGLSNTSAALFPALEEEAGRVTYLVDGDAGGLALRDDLTASGVEESRIMIVSGDDWETPEDLLAEGILSSAVGAELEPFLDAGTTIPAELTVGKGRAKRIEDWSIAIGISPPSKVRIAQRVIDHRASHDPEGPVGQRLTTDAADVWLLQAHAAFCAAFHLDV